MTASRRLGRVLLVLGFLIGPAAAVMCAVSLINAALGVDPFAQQLLTFSVVAFLTTPLFLMLGWVIAAGKKGLVLFLRRFGNEILNEAVRDIVRRRLRKRARLVTLDDSAFSPLGPRWQGLASSLTPSLIVLVGIALGYAEFARLAQSELRQGMPFGEILAYVQLAIIFVGLLAGSVFVILFVGGLRAHFVARRVVRDSDSRARVVRQLRNSRAFERAPAMAAPMAVVVTAADSEWRATVKSIAEICDVALIDISHARENIRWELTTLREAGPRIILLAQRDSLARWWDLTGEHAEAQLAKKLRSVATGLPLLTYDAPDRLDEGSLLELLCLSP